MDDEAPNQIRCRLTSVEFNHTAMQCAVPLISFHDGEPRCLGSGFMVLPGLAITASHVVRAWHDRTGGRPSESDPVSVMAIQWADGRFNPWELEQVSLWDAADLAFLRFKKPNWYGDAAGQIKTPFPRLSVDPPRPGDTVRVFGFPDSSVDNGTLYISPSECIATVRMVEIKSKLMIRPLSYAELEGEVRGGMSGGPCFDEEWNVVGMVSRGWEFLPTEPEGSPLSYMALLWPIMSLQIDHFGLGVLPAWHFFKDGPAQVRGYERLQVYSDGAAEIAHLAPRELVPFHVNLEPHFYNGALSFHGENATRALADIRSLLFLEGTENTEKRMNRLYRALANYFWSLEAALLTAMRCAVLEIERTAQTRVNWHEVKALLSGCGPSPKQTDVLASLDLAWNGRTLFETREYAEGARQGTLVVESLEFGNTIAAAALAPCRTGGSQVHLPEGLQQFYDSASRFARRLLRVAKEMALSREGGVQKGEPDVS